SCCHTITGNVFRLGDVAEIEAQIFSFAHKFNRRTAVEFSTSAATFAKPLLAVVLLFVSNCLLSHFALKI
ncbi:MAG: hypothetical protein ACK5PO_02370, partial [Bacteroidota bacterium]